MLIDEQLFSHIIDIAKTAPFRTRRQAAYVLANGLLIGSSEQVHYIVALGCIGPLCDLLNFQDNALVSAVLSALSRVLHHGSTCPQFAGRGNPYSDLIEQCRGCVCSAFVLIGFNCYTGTSVFRESRQDKRHTHILFVNAEHYVT